MLASDAPYTNKHKTEARFTLKMTKNKVEDGELDVFGAEKYFKGVVDEEFVRTSNTGIRYCSHRPPKYLDEPCPAPKLKTTSSVRSESSWNSRKGLLVSNGPNGSNGNKHGKKTSVKSLFASLGCNCNNKGSVKVTKAKQPVKDGGPGQKTKPLSSEAKQPVKGGDPGEKTKPLSPIRADEGVNIKREDCFTFPVLNPTKAEILESSRTGGQSDTGSDRSSDLFEIESFSTNENNFFLAGQATENSVYAPSEASVEWSVVTASVAGFSTPEDLVVTKNVKGGSGILLGCKSLKAVRVSGDERGEKVVGSATRREWCNRLEPITPVAKIQADTKLICAGSALHTSHRIHSKHASSQNLFMK